MADKRTTYTDYAVHGHGTASLARGFDEIGMPAVNRPVAVEIVDEVLTANGATARCGLGG